MAAPRGTVAPGGGHGPVAASRRRVVRGRPGPRRLHRATRRHPRSRDDAHPHDVHAGADDRASPPSPPPRPPPRRPPATRSTAGRRRPSRTSAGPSAASAWCGSATTTATTASCGSSPARAAPPTRCTTSTRPSATASGDPVPVRGDAFVEVLITSVGIPAAGTPRPRTHRHPPSPERWSPRPSRSTAASRATARRSSASATSNARCRVTTLTNPTRLVVDVYTG